MKLKLLILRKKSVVFRRKVFRPFAFKTPALVSI